MPLNAYRVGPAVAVSDMRRAKDFYEGKLGLSADGDDADGGRTYGCDEQTSLHVFPSAGYEGGTGATLADWSVDDLESVVDELTARGVAFERYDNAAVTTNEKGIAVLGGRKSAWFKDPDRNLLGLVET
jgi:catechol 2,3-dioxygenase-like lactoylglutathione lyase family enzyme